MQNSKYPKGLKTKGETMSYNTVPGKGGFFELENGEELFLTPDMIPEPPASTFTDNPHEQGSDRFKRWRIAAKARYSKAWYRATVDAKNTADFLAKVGSAEAILQDPSAWDNYKSCRGMNEYKRPVGRPKLEESEKVNRPPRKKRSDAMRALLEENGYRVLDTVVLDARSNKLGEFLLNGRIRTPEKDVISVFQFIHDYV